MVCKLTMYQSEKPVSNKAAPTCENRLLNPLNLNGLGGVIFMFLSKKVLSTFAVDSTLFLVYLVTFFKASKQYLLEESQRVKLCSLLSYTAWISLETSVVV